MIINTLTKSFSDFFKSEKIAGLILIIATIASLSIANSTFGGDYLKLLHSNIMGKDIEFWVNDVLMTIFFLLIGLELEREIYQGELSNIKDTILPLFAAIGGMVIPAFLFLVFNFNSPYSSGFGIPMATDIAFAIGVLSLLGNKVPNSLKVFLIALAIFDDLGAILLIAIAYSNDIIISNILWALLVYIILIILNKSKVHHFLPYLLGGIVMWYFIYNSGIHPTITGVLLAFAIPFDKKKEKSCSYKFENFLHKPVSFFILPIFALVNTAILINVNAIDLLKQPYTMGVIIGLFVGKPLGILVFSKLGHMFKLYSLPKGIKFKHIFSVGILAGIGFTMSIFITLLAFDSVEIQNDAKIAILVASCLSAIVGLLLLNKVLPKNNQINQNEFS